MCGPRSTAEPDEQAATGAAMERFTGPTSTTRPTGRIVNMGTASPECWPGWQQQDDCDGPPRHAHHRQLRHSAGTLPVDPLTRSRTSDVDGVVAALITGGREGIRTRKPSRPSR